jgi:hypothetical protein
MLFQLAEYLSELQDLVLIVANILDLQVECDRNHIENGLFQVPLHKQ